MSQFDNLIYDRTAADIEHRNELHRKLAAGIATASELAEWGTCALKGAYNYTDLNRVGSMLNTVKTLSAEIGISVNYPYPVVNNYSRSSILSAVTIERLLANIAAVKTAYGQRTKTAVPTAIKTIYDANDIEYLLAEVGIAIEGTKAEYKYAGDAYSGGI